MNKPSSDVFWAFIVTIVLASALAATGFIMLRSDKAVEGIYRIADGLVTGGLGFFAGRASAPNPTPVEPAPKE